MMYLKKKLKEIYNIVTGTTLNVPYIPQINNNACGAAVLEMVYRYYRLKDVSQSNLYDTYRVLEPHGSGNLRFDTDSLVADASGRGFLASWKRARYEDKKSVINLFKELVQKNKLPIIVCQKFTDEQPLIGHFRVVVGISREKVYVHDPHVTLGGAYQEWPVEKFIDFWKPTGQNVTGGIYVVIKKS